MHETGPTVTFRFCLKQTAGFELEQGSLREREDRERFVRRDATEDALRYRSRK